MIPKLMTLVLPVLLISTVASDDDLEHYRQ